MTPACTVVVADSQSLFLDGLSAILTGAGYVVTDTASDLAGLVARLRAVTPTICLLDPDFPDGDAITSVPELIEVSPRTRLVVLTADPSAAAMRRALEAGVSGYVQKSRNAAVLLDALGRVGDDHVVVEASFSRPTPAHARDLDVRRLADFLTPRERECLELLASGRDTTAIAGELGVSPTTVRTHIQSLLSKLGAHSRLEAVSMAMRHRIVRAS